MCVCVFNLVLLAVSLQSIVKSTMYVYVYIDILYIYLYFLWFKGSDTEPAFLFFRKTKHKTECN